MTRGVCLYDRRVYPCDMVHPVVNQSRGVQGYLAHKKQPPPLRPPKGHRYFPTVGSWGNTVSYDRGTPVHFAIDPRGVVRATWGVYPRLQCVCLCHERCVSMSQGGLST